MTTKKDFEIFKEECEKWLDYFGLKDWNCYYYHEKLDKDDAQTIGSINDKQAVIKLNTEWSEKDDGYELKKTAFHEVIEVLLIKLRCMAEGTYPANEYTIDEECHSIIYRLTHTIFDKEEKKEV